MRWMRHVEMRNLYIILVERTQEKNQLGIPRLRWEDNIKTDLREVRCERVG
jgi:hypothetical protein